MNQGIGRQRQPRSLAIRRLWLKIHLYIGLSCGAVLVVIGLTGSVMVFGQVIDEWSNPDLFGMGGQGEKLPAARPLNEIVAAAKGALPPQGILTNIAFPHSVPGIFRVGFQMPTAVPGQFDSYEIIVDSSSGQVRGSRLWYRPSRPWDGPLMSVIMYVHVSLLLDQPGATTVGIIGTLMMFSIVTGVIIWWPQSGRFRQALAIKRRVGRMRVLHDLHNTVGIYSALVVFLLLFTGISMYEPVRVIPHSIAKLLSPLTEVPQDLTSSQIPGKESLTPEDAVAVVSRLFPDGTMKGLNFPDTNEGVYVVTQILPDAVPERQVWVDQYSGQALFVKEPRTNTIGDTFWDWLFPLHTGEALGLPGRITVLIAGLVPVVLFATGIVMWVRKQRLPKWLARG